MVFKLINKIILFHYVVNQSIFKSLLFVENIGAVTIFKMHLVAIAHVPLVT